MLSTQLNSSNPVGLPLSETNLMSTDPQMQTNQDGQIAAQSPHEQLKLDA